MLNEKSTGPTLKWKPIICPFVVMVCSFDFDNLSLWSFFLYFHVLVFFSSVITCLIWTPILIVDCFSFVLPPIWWLPKKLELFLKFTQQRRSGWFGVGFSGNRSDFSSFAFSHFLSLAAFSRALNNWLSCYCSIVCSFSFAMLIIA